MHSLHYIYFLLLRYIDTIKNTVKPGILKPKKTVKGNYTIKYIYKNYKQKLFTKGPISSFFGGPQVKSKMLGYFLCVDISGDGELGYGNKTQTLYIIFA